MDLFDYDLESTFNHAQNYGAYHGYYWENKEEIWTGQRHQVFLNSLQTRIQTGQTVLMVGVGFGWFVDKMLEINLGPICAIDTSEWIHTYKHIHSSIDIHNIDVTDYSTHSTIKSILNLSSSDKIDWCITEDFYTEITDSKCVEIATALRTLGNNVIHYITRCPPASSFSNPEILQRNWKTKEDWETLLSPDEIYIR